MKDELGGEIMKEFVSLRLKKYSYRVGNLEPKKCIVKHTISFDDYKRYLVERVAIGANYYLDLANTKLGR